MLVIYINYTNTTDNFQKYLYFSYIFCTIDSQKKRSGYILKIIYRSDNLRKFKFCILSLFAFLFFSFGVSAKDQTVMDIVMATDNNYVYPTLVSMTSIVENKKEDSYPKFHLMLSGSISDENKQRFEKFEKIYGNQNCSVELIDMKDKFKNIPSGRCATPTYYRLLIPSILPNCEKILYLDGDTTIIKDLQDLYNIDISDYYVAGCIDFDTCLLRPGYEKNLNVPDRNQYINAGVLLLNVKNMRKDNIGKKMEGLAPYVKKRKLILQDQDIINSICYGKIKLINPKYNVMTHQFRKYNSDLSKIKQQLNDLQISYNDPTIIHYTGGKPWKNPNCKKYDVWDKYRKKVEDNFYEKKKFNGKYKLVSKLDENKVIDIRGGAKENYSNVNLWDFNNSNAQKFDIYYDSQGTYKIKALCSRKVLDVSGGSKKSGTNVIQYEEHHGDNQKWFLKDAGDGYFYIISKCNNMYLDVENSNVTNGTNVRVCDFNGSDNQKFKIVRV